MKYSLLTFMLLWSLIGFSAEKEYFVEQRNIIDEGLSQNRILCILEDNQGFMWFGTADGLNKYDGYSFTIYRRTFDNSNGLSGNYIQTLANDSQGNIWIGTKRGLSKFMPLKDSFVTINDNDFEKDSKGANNISCCVSDENDNIWCGTEGCGVFVLDSKSNKRKYISFSDDYVELRYIESLLLDDNNNLWIGFMGYGKIIRYNIDSGEYITFCLSNVSDNSARSLRIGDLYQSENGTIWASFLDHTLSYGGLYYFDSISDSFINVFEHYNKEYAKAYSNPYSVITSITGDKNGNIYATGILGGVFKISSDFVPEGSYLEAPGVDISNLCVYYSSTGILWIGTNGKGLQLALPNNAEINLITEKVSNNFGIQSVRDIIEDDEYYWVGGYHGLTRISKDFKKINYVFAPNVYCIAECLNDDDKLWIGSEGGGLELYDKNTQKVLLQTEEEIGDDMFLANYVFSILPINDSLIILGTEGGVAGYNPQNNDLFYFPLQNKKDQEFWKTPAKHFSYDLQGNILVGYNVGGVGIVNILDTIVESYSPISSICELDAKVPVNCILCDTGYYWLGTSNGLLFIDELNGNYRFYTEKDGLPNSYIYSIIKDDSNNLWISSNNGLSSFNISTKQITNYDISDGLQSNEFNNGAYYKSRDNTLFFGGINGLNYFKPSNLDVDEIVSKPVITSIKMGNKKVLLSDEIINNHHLVINPDVTVFTIEFAGLSYFNSFRNKYKYRIKELGNEWIELGNVRSITFNNMTPGKYTLEVIASNNHGHWFPQPLVISIDVVPMFYENNWFKIVLIIVVVIILILLVKYRLMRLKSQQKKLQKFADKQSESLIQTNKALTDEIAERKKTALDLKASNDTKDKFISIIAHDILNPLGVILGFSDIIKNNYHKLAEKEILKYNKTINLTAHSLNVMLSNLLQWSRLDNNAVVPKPERIHLSTQINNCLRVLYGLVDGKNIDLIINIEESVVVYADLNMLFTIIRNLVSNSIKFTPSEGNIIVSATNSATTTTITVEDNGIGIPDDVLKNIFQMKKGFTTRGTDNESGTGLGLTLVHEFVMMNNGEIYVESEVNKGTSFIIKFPVKKPIYE